MIPYILNAGLVLTGCLAFYMLLLKKETFYKVNRFLLMLCLIIAFSLPLLHVPQQFSLRKSETVTINNKRLPVNNVDLNNTSVDENSNQTNASVQNAASSFSFNDAMKWIGWLYWFGVIVFALNFLVQIIMLLYRAYTNPVILDGRFRIVEVTGNKAPCSFGNNIFINPEKYDGKHTIKFCNMRKFIFIKNIV